jgi:anti-sigma B factor antagonist
VVSLANPLFEVVFAQQDDLCLVRVRGELDLAHADAFGALLTTLADRTVVIDLSDLSFIDSSGFTAIVRAKNRAVELDRELVLTRPRPNVERLFTLTGLSELIAPWRSEWQSDPSSFN